MLLWPGGWCCCIKSGGGGRRDMGRHADRVRRVRVRQKGREEEEEGRDVAPPPPPKHSFSLAQSPCLRPSRSSTLHSCSHTVQWGRGGWMDGWTYRRWMMDAGGGSGGREGEVDWGQAGWMERKRGGGGWRGEGFFFPLCLVISSHSLPSGAVVRWLAAHPGGPRACAGPRTRRRLDPGCRLGCSGRSSWRLPGRRPPRFHLWGCKQTQTLTN